MSILDILFDAGKRRQARLDALVASRAELQADFDRAVAAGDDTDKAFAKLEKCDGEIRAARAAIDATAAEKARQVQADAAMKANQVVEEARVAFGDYVRECTEAARLATAFAEQWLSVQDAAALALAAERRASEAGLGLRTLTGRHTGPAAVWQRIWMLVLRELKKPGELPMHFPTLPARPQVESVESWLARELESHMPTKEKAA